MPIHADAIETIADKLLRPRSTLTADEATTIGQLAELTAGVDLAETSEERVLLDELIRHIDALADHAPGTPPPVSPLPLDAEERAAWIHALAVELETPGTRELAYSIAYVVAVTDHELAPVEAELLEELRLALDIDEARAADLVATVSELITPGSEEVEPVH
jgi:hypothetical protein